VFDRQHPLAEVVRKLAAHSFIEELMQARQVRPDRVARRKVILYFFLFCLLVLFFLTFLVVPVCLGDG